MPFRGGGSDKVRKTGIKDILQLIFIGRRYQSLKNINEQARYLTVNFVFMVVMIPLISLGYTMIGMDNLRAEIDFGFAGLLIVCLALMRIRKVPFQIIPNIMVSFYGVYCLYLLYQGSLSLWASVWIFCFPVIAIFLCGMALGIIQSSVVLAAALLLLFANLMSRASPVEIKLRYIGAYILLFALAIIYERISILKDKKEAQLKAELATERDVIQTMKDNINQGIFLMDKELRILPQYSRPLITILSYYDLELAGKSFLDILSSSLDSKQLQTMRSYFSMMFEKKKSSKVLASANPISEFDYKVDDRLKTLSTRFNLVEEENTEPVIVGIIEDITREKEFERELQTQKEAQELEMKNMFDVLQVDPLVFQDFVEDTEANFNYINSLLKDKSLDERQVVTKFFQNIHAIKSNALILGLESFGNKLHALEDEIKVISSYEKVSLEDVLSLAVKLEGIMQEKDSYLKTVKKIDAFKSSNQMDSVLLSSLRRAVEKCAAETQKKVELKAGYMDLGILGSKLRKPIKDILFQCVRNSIYHGIETVEKRIEKNKKPQGLLVFSIRSTDGKAEVTFSDDGGGLNWDKIKAKYLETHPKASGVTKQILLSSIFSPQFSTSEESTTLAGRGVGLSLVKDIVKENHGSIKVESTESGLTFRFVFPLAA